ncbi:hypothetical protein [Devosia sp.]|uniref:hypothetical protein n=1 Tax=Devosia sp. TaxID=1871048 RepID=UPI002AFEA70C|nr:hypothetical protein [Devosia sp.]
MTEDGVEAGRLFGSGGQEMIGADSIWLVTVKLPKRSKLVAQYVEHQPRIHFRIIHMAALEATIMIMLDQMVVRIAWEGQRIEPQRVDWRREQLRQRWPDCRKVWQVVSQDIMPEQV